MSLNDKRVAVNFSGVTRYFDQLPFHPPERYPEYEGPEVQEGNNIYSAVRQVLYQAGFDQGRYGTPEWDPFGEFIEPGMTVFIKPNTDIYLLFGMIRYVLENNLEDKDFINTYSKGIDQLRDISRELGSDLQ